MKHFSSSIVMSFSSFFLSCALSAQPLELRLQRIVDEVPLVGEEALERQRQRHIIDECEVGYPLAIQIPGYQAAEADVLNFGIAHFFDSGGGGGGGVAIDENGVIHSSRRCIIDTSGNVMVTKHYLVFSQNRATGEYRYYLDLSDVPLTAFARQFASSYRPVPQDSSTSPRPRRGQILEVVDSFADDVLVPFLQGAGITFEQTLELLRRESGCDVIQAEGKLIIDWCG